MTDQFDELRRLVGGMAPRYYGYDEIHALKTLLGTFIDVHEANIAEVDRLRARVAELKAEVGKLEDELEGWRYPSSKELHRIAEAVAAERAGCAKVAAVVADNACSESGYTDRQEPRDKERVARLIERRIRERGETG